VRFERRVVIGQVGERVTFIHSQPPNFLISDDPYERRTAAPKNSKH
jgi:hypothetical protein